MAEPFQLQVSSGPSSMVQEELQTSAVIAPRPLREFSDGLEHINDCKQEFGNLLPATGPGSNARDSLARKLDAIVVDPPFGYAEVDAACSAATRVAQRTVAFGKSLAAVAAPSLVAAAAQGFTTPQRPFGRATSTASTASCASSSLDLPTGAAGAKRPRPSVTQTPDEVDDDALSAAGTAVKTAAADAARSSFASTFSNRGSREARVFTPMIADTHQSQRALCAALDVLGRRLLVYPHGSLLSMTESQFTDAPFVTAFGDDAPPEVREAVASAVAALAECRSAAQALQLHARIMVRMYWLATHTGGANWDTVQQVLFRENYDREMRLVDVVAAGDTNDAPLVTPLRKWPEKVAEAMKVLGQERGLSKDGAVLGPLCPELAAARGGGNAGQAARGRGGRPASATAARGGNNPRGRGRGGSGKGGKARSFNRTDAAAAGARAPATAAAQGAAAATGGG
jgi:hypothetical protein